MVEVANLLKIMEDGSSWTTVTTSTMMRKWKRNSVKDCWKENKRVNPQSQNSKDSIRGNAQEKTRHNILSFMTWITSVVCVLISHYTCTLRILEKSGGNVGIEEERGANERSSSHIDILGGLDLDKWEYVLDENPTKCDRWIWSEWRGAAWRIGTNWVLRTKRTHCRMEYSHHTLYFRDQLQHWNMT